MSGIRFTSCSMRDAILKKDKAAALSQVEEDSGSAEGVNRILQGMKLAGIRHQDTRFPTPHGVIYADAVRDLAPTYAGEAPELLFRGALETLFRLDYREVRLNAFDLDEAGRPDVVAVHEFYDALAEGNTEASFSAAARLLGAIRSHDILLENLNFLAAHHVTRLGHTLIFTHSTVKGIVDLKGEAIHEFLYGLILYLTSRDLPFPGRPAGDERELPWKIFLRRALKDPGLLHHNLIFVTHAFQAQRFAQLNRARLLPILRRSLADRFPGWEEDKEPADPAPETPPKTGENLQSLEPSDREPIREALLKGEADAARASIRRVWGRVADVDPLFRPIAEACGTKGDPLMVHDLIYINAARWGAHLLGDEGLELIDQVVDHICRMPPRESE
ncbi:MAG: hypothetical protein KJ970_14565 [Candidatus Eisenbacteria bacterium]|uniref:Uncharacterized protein n=1 Tax=Eiseniibacteriota bacterium TaxID=2212470 RepID=A0A948W7Y6_UNCEI|nr:hypothetical protein [Candidatus Eisenbacteria bacterium]MBU1949465.1 hypothetical protein [Candidatus Eisenbacteria bacterium]MBU2692141.1 hypothetical protein [Candidatus Eisenbacteria bacterium]